jgi:ferredoxin
VGVAAPGGGSRCAGAQAAAGTLREEELFMATIKVDGSSAEVADGKRLVLAIEEDLGIDILHKCGGNAMCTTCRVEFVAGEPSKMTEAERVRLQDRGLLGQARLSCQVACAGEMTVTPLMRLSTSGADDPGPKPAEEITPPAVWIDA